MNKHKRTSIHIITLLGVCLWGAGSVGGEPMAYIADADRIYDFGDITRGKDYEHTFTLCNRGDAPLVIQRILALGRARVVEPTYVILAGRSGNITTGFWSGKRRGPETQKCIILTNDPQSPKIELFLKANIIYEIDYAPEIIRFAHKPRSVDLKRTVVLKSAPANDLIVKEVSSSNSGTVHCGPVKKFGEARTGQIVEIPVTILKGGKIGAMNEEILIRTNSEVDSEIRIPVIGEVGPDYKVTPERLFLGVVHQGQEVRKTIKIEFFGDRIPEVKRVRTRNGFVETTIRPTQGAGWLRIVDVVFHAGHLYGNINDEIYVTATECPVLRVPVSGYVVERKTLRR